MSIPQQQVLQQVQQLFGMAMQHLQGGNPQLARAMLEQVRSVWPEHPGTLHYLGLLWAMEGRPVEGEQLLRRALALRPDIAEAHHHHGLVLRNMGQAELSLASFGRALALRPEMPQAHCDLGLALEDLGRLQEAAAAYGKAVALAPDFADAHNNHGLVLLRLEQPAQALAAFQAATRAQPGFAQAQNNCGLALEELARYGEALAAYQRAVSVAPGLAEAWDHCGNVLQKLDRIDEALVHHQHALELKPDHAPAWNNRGNALARLQRPVEAMQSLDKALALAPDFPEAHNNRGNLFERLGRHADALACYERAIACRANYAEAYFNRGNALSELQRDDEAVRSFDECLRLDPGHVAARNNVFMHHFRILDDQELIERLGMEAAAASLREEAARRREAGAIAEFRIRHDLEQIEYLCGLGRTTPELEQAGERLRVLQDAPAAGAYPFESLLLRHAVAQDFESCLGDNDWRGIEERYFASRPEMIWIDNLLSPRALEELQRFCLASTVWKREYGNGYLGAFAPQGFLSPLHLRIACELKEKMPRIFGPHALEQLWAFKYDTRMAKGINVHADFARVNLNFWITPDDANLDPETGGMLIYDVPSPADWPFRKYNESERGIYDFLQQNRANCVKVPYRCNRAVLFNSMLFHETDEISFREGYENRRINVTYLFGRGLMTA
ncbi:MAG TPA: tetratricopeptide repeat protein [Burkholderiales bacterium]|jgi:tetratricopeptide (TPR) repeat protein|nr:tetratricopeptide repeat protein [Burkholderiales bacterium]